MPIHCARALVLVCVVTLAVSERPAFGWGSKRCHDCDGSTSRGDDSPRVVTRDTVRLGRSLPVIGTIYTPMAAMPLGVAAGREISVERGDDGDSSRMGGTGALHSAQVAEIAALRQAQSRAALKEEIDFAQRIYDRLGTSSASTPSTMPSDQLQALTAKIDKLAERVAAIEKMVLIHDNVLKSQVENIQAPK